MEYAHINSFMKNPEKVWDILLREMKKIIDSAKPNGGHKALAFFEKSGCLKTIITQNIDGLHQLAGNTDVIEFHGNFASYRCLDCGKSCATGEISLAKLPPVCSCGGIFRPNCIFFGEAIPHDSLYRSQKLASECDVMLLIGTSATVQPFASLPAIAKRHGARIIEINPEETPLTKNVSDYLIPGKAVKVLDGIAKLLQQNSI
jgi:NAD-dependent deacetylase